MISLFNTRLFSWFKKPLKSQCNLDKQIQLNSSGLYIAWLNSFEICYFDNLDSHCIFGQKVSLLLHCLLFVSHASLHHILGTLTYQLLSVLIFLPCVQCMLLFLRPSHISVGRAGPQRLCLGFVVFRGLLVLFDRSSAIALPSVIKRETRRGGGRAGIRDRATKNNKTKVVERDWWGKLTVAARAIAPVLRDQSPRCSR